MQTSCKNIYKLHKNNTISLHPSYKNLWLLYRYIGVSFISPISTESQSESICYELPNLSQSIIKSKSSANGLCIWKLDRIDNISKKLSSPVITTNMGSQIKLFCSNLSYKVSWISSCHEFDQIQFYSNIDNYNKKKLYLLTDQDYKFASYKENEGYLIIENISSFYVKCKHKIELRIEVIIPQKFQSMKQSIKIDDEKIIVSQYKDNILIPTTEFDEIAHHVRNTYEIKSIKMPFMTDKIPRDVTYDNILSFTSYNNNIWTNTINLKNRLGEYRGYYAFAVDNSHELIIKYKLKMSIEAFAIPNLIVCAAKYKNGSTFVNHKYKSKDAITQHYGNYPPRDGELIEGSIQLEKNSENVALYVTNDKFGLLTSGTEDAITFIEVIVEYIK